MSCHVRLWFVPGRTGCGQSEGVDRGAVTARAVACQRVAALRVAALYDFHANVPALEAVLAEVERVSFDRIVIGVDVVPGPLPVETFERLRALGDRAVFRARQRRSLGSGHVRHAGLDERGRRAPGAAVGGVDRRCDRPARP
jgi:hypothetical protein